MKKGVFRTSAVLSSLSLLPLVAADSDTIAKEWGRTAAGAIAGFLDTLRLNPTALSTIMLAILLWIVVYSIIKNIFHGEENSGVLLSGGAAAAITILSFIYLPENFVEAIALQYGALGATLLSLIPLLIMLYFTVAVAGSLILAKAAWLFYVVYYAVLFIYKISTIPAGSPWTEYAPYVIAMILGILIFVFIVKVRELWQKGRLDEAEERAIRDINFRRLGRDIERQETTARTDFSGGSVA